MTNSVYELCDVWQMANTLSSYSLSVHNKIDEYDLNIMRCRNMNKHFEALKRCDKDTVQEALEQKMKNNNVHQHDGNDKITEKQLLEQMEVNITSVLQEVNQQMRLERGTRNELTLMVQQMLNENARNRLINCKENKHWLESHVPNTSIDQFREVYKIFSSFEAECRFNEVYQ